MKDWQSCVNAAQRLADMTCAIYCPRDETARKIFPTTTWAEIIAAELDIPSPSDNKDV